MNDLISRSALGVGYANPLVFDNPAFAKGWNAAIEIIAKVPAVDAVEVVRCKDCIYKGPIDRFGDLYCPILGVPMQNNDFCSYGERSANDPYSKRA